MDYINLTPTWSGLLPALLALIEQGPKGSDEQHEAAKAARQELVNMAKAADRYNLLVERLQHLRNSDAAFAEVHAILRGVSRG